MKLASKLKDVKATIKSIKAEIRNKIKSLPKPSYKLLNQREENKLINELHSKYFSHNVEIYFDFDHISNHRPGEDKTKDLYPVTFVLPHKACMQFANEILNNRKSLEKFCKALIILAENSKGYNDWAVYQDKCNAIENRYYIGDNAYMAGRKSTI